MIRLQPACLPALAGKGIIVPRYDRGALRPGLIHIGVGAFHRCHQAEYTDDLIDAGHETRYVTGLSLRSPAITPLLEPQSGLYSRTLVQDGVRDIRIIGCLGRVIDQDGLADRLLSVLADPAMTVATLTITEKGYCHVPATGALDTDHSEIVADLATPTAPVSLPGLLTQALARRRLTDAAGMTLIACDNVPANGQVLRRVVLAMAAARGAGLADWVAAHVQFPSTMVDRIVPATTEADLAAFRDRTGIEDAAAVVGEPFRQWVIEHCPAGDLPRWDRVGATFAADVTAHERIKMRLLNGAQSAMAFVGCLLGLATTCDGIHHPALRQFLHRMLTRETAPTLPLVPGMEPLPYIASTVRRLENRAIRHSNHQIATDGSQKIVQRLLAPAAERLAAGQDAPMLIAAAAAWAAYLAAAAPRYGARWVPSDPLAAKVRDLAAACDGPRELAGAVLALDAVFAPDLAADARFRAGFEQALERWLTRPTQEVLAGYAAA